MAEIDYDALQRLADAATEGPWLVDAHHWGAGIMDDDGDQLFVESHGLTYSVNPKDAEFIAAARSAVPALLDRVRELEAEKVCEHQNADYLRMMTDDEKRELIAEARELAPTAAFADGSAFHTIWRLADALEGALTEPEWEYRIRGYYVRNKVTAYGAVIDQETAEAIMARQDDGIERTLQKRVAPGPWEPTDEVESNG